MSAHSLSDAAWLTSINGVPVNDVLRKVDAAHASAQFDDQGYVTFAVNVQNGATSTTDMKGKVYRVGSDMTYVANARFTFVNSGGANSSFSFSIARGVLQTATETVQTGALVACTVFGIGAVPLVVPAWVLTAAGVTLITVSPLVGLANGVTYTVSVSGMIPFTSGPSLVD